MLTNEWLARERLPLKALQQAPPLVVVAEAALENSNQLIDHADLPNCSSTKRLVAGPATPNKRGSGDGSTSKTILVHIPRGSRAAQSCWPEASIILCTDQSGGRVRWQCCCRDAIVAETI